MINKMAQTKARDAVTFIPITNIPLITPGVNLPKILAESVQKQGLSLDNGDILVIAQKIVSKAEDRTLDISGLTPSQEALTLAEKTSRPPKFVQAVLDESKEVLMSTDGTEKKPGILVTKHNLGHVCTSAGIDKSNTGVNSLTHVVLLPEDPDNSAQEIAKCIKERVDRNVSVIIIDSMGDPHRHGAIGKTIGISNIPSLLKQTDLQDLDGKPSKASIAFADGIAGMAMLMTGQTNEKIPAVLVKGLDYPDTPESKTSDVLIE